MWNVDLLMPLPRPSSRKVMLSATMRISIFVTILFLAPLGAERGVIEKVLWRVPREKPNLTLTGEAMMELLAPKRLLREVRKQLKLDSQENKAHTKAFEQSRQQLIASQISPDTQNPATVIR